MMERRTLNTQYSMNKIRIRLHFLPHAFIGSVHFNNTNPGKNVYLSAIKT